MIQGLVGKIESLVDNTIKLSINVQVPLEQVAKFDKREIVFELYDEAKQETTEDQKAILMRMREALEKMAAAIDEVLWPPAVDPELPPTASEVDGEALSEAGEGVGKGSREKRAEISTRAPDATEHTEPPDMGHGG